MRHIIVNISRKRVYYFGTDQKWSNVPSNAHCFDTWSAAHATIMRMHGHLYNEYMAFQAMTPGERAAYSDSVDIDDLQAQLRIWSTSIAVTDPEGDVSQRPPENRQLGLAL